MQSFSSRLLTVEAIGAATGAFIHGVAGYLSQEDRKEIKKNLLIGAIAGSILAALGTMLFMANNTGATLGALAGLILYTQLDGMPLFSQDVVKDIESIVKFMMCGALLGYTSSSIFNYAVSLIFRRS